MRETTSTLSEEWADGDSFSHSIAKHQKKMVTIYNSGQELDQLQASIERVRAIILNLQKDYGEYFSSKKDCFHFIEYSQQDFPLSVMFRVFKVSRSAYYSWKKEPVCRRKKENELLINLIKNLYEKSGRKHGSPTIHRKLRGLGLRCGHNRVAKLMKQYGLYAIKSKETNQMVGKVGNLGRKPEQQLQYKKEKEDL